MTPRDRREWAEGLRDLASLIDASTWLPIPQQGAVHVALLGGEENHLLLTSICEELGRLGTQHIDQTHDDYREVIVQLRGLSYRITYYWGDEPAEAS